MNFKHGETKTKLYKAWDSMKSRCFHDKKYSHVMFCDEWKDFLTFKEWALQSGYEEGLSLDRINNEKGYEPSNCRWVTRSVQAFNRKHGKYVTINGITKHLTDWATDYGITKNTVYKRIQRGWTCEEAIIGRNN